MTEKSERRREDLSAMAQCRFSPSLLTVEAPFATDSTPDSRATRIPRDINADRDRDALCILPRSTRMLRPASPAVDHCRHWECCRECHNGSRGTLRNCSGSERAVVGGRWTWRTTRGSGGLQPGSWVRV